MEYNDYQIMTPDKMDMLAKEYFKKINTNCNLSLQYKEIISYLLKVEALTEKLITYCNTRRLFDKKNIAQSCKQNIKKLLDNFSTLKTQDVPPLYAKNYCEAIFLCINNINLIIKICIETLCQNIDENSTKTIKNCALVCIGISNNLAKMFVPCKYCGWK